MVCKSAWVLHASGFVLHSGSGSSIFTSSSRRRHSSRNSNSIMDRTIGFDSNTQSHSYRHSTVLVASIG